MAEKELVITHLQIIHTWADFAREKDLQFFTKKHLEDIAQWSEDAINLLKEQEPVAPVLVGRMWECGKCYAPVGIFMDDQRDQFCRTCGTKVNWDA